MRAWKTVDFEFASETVPIFRVRVFRHPSNTYEVKISGVSEIEEPIPDVLREWSEVLAAAATQLQEWQEEDVVASVDDWRSNDEIV